MSPRTRWCAFPWDFAGDPAAPARALDSGAGGVAIAAAYHSVRAATPLHPKHRVVEAPSAAFYLPIRSAAWQSSRLRPKPALDWAGDHAFEKAADQVRSVGLDAEAWVVLTHSSALGSEHPEVCVRNAFGDTYRYALCPSHPDVRTYAAILVAETVELSGVTTLMVEACGPLGIEHLGSHEKTAGADWAAVDAQLLSLCFCTACRRALAERDVDPELLRRRVKVAIGTGVGRIEDVLGDDANAVHDVRAHGTEQLARSVSAAARDTGATNLNYHAQPGRWATGPFAALLSTPGIADGFILPADRFLDRRARVPLTGGERVGAYLSALPPAEAAHLVEQWGPDLAGVDDLYLYHFGLLSTERLNAVGALINALRSG